jgi:uncharacterized protein (AIM24 family)
MQTEIMYGPSYAAAKLTLTHGETVRAEAGAMLAMSPGIAIETSTQGQSITVDTGHMVAWTDGVSYNVRTVGSWKSTFFSGGDLVCDLTGPGRVYLQTRSQDAFLEWLIPKLPQPSNNG